MKDFIQKNRVAMLAFLSALILTLQQIVATKETDWKVIGFAVLTAMLGVMANQWKGKGISILGILGNLAGIFNNIYQTGTFTWNEFILASLLALLTSFAASLAPEPAAGNINPSRNE